VGTSFDDLLYEYFDWVAGVIVVGGLMLAGASLIGLGAVALAVAVPWRRGGVPRCGKCAYPVSGVQSWSCPECGGDYHSMGIIAPHHRRLIHPMVTVPLFSIFLVAPATVVALIAIAVGPQHVTYTDNVGLTPKEAAGYEQVQLYARSARGGAKHTAVALEVHIETPATWYLYEVDFGTMMYVDSDYATGTSAVPPQPFDRAGLEQMFQTAGVDTTQPLFKRQMDELWPIIQDAPGIGLHRTQVSLFDITYNDTWTDQGPAVWWMVLVGLVAVAVWAAGVGGSWRCMWRGRAGGASGPLPSGRLLGCGI